MSSVTQTHSTDPEKLCDGDVDGPALSVALVTRDSWKSQARTLEHLRAQTICDQLEIVFVARSAEALALDSRAIAGFHSCRIAEAWPIQSIASGYAKGVRSATALIVAFGEDHAFPESGWAAALLEAHRGPWAAVGPIMCNANPTNIISRTDMMIGYGLFIDPARAGERDYLPGHNSSYKRETLLAYGDHLEQILESEFVLHMDMRRKGLKLKQAADARTRHTNFARLLPWTRVQYLTGRTFASFRSKSWSLARRAFYMVASPLIVPLRLWRFLCYLKDPAWRRQLPPLLPLLVYGLAADAFGQLIGYALGEGDSIAATCDLEFHRYRFVRNADRSRFDIREDPFVHPVDIAPALR